MAPTPLVRQRSRSVDSGTTLGPFNERLMDYTHLLLDLDYTLLDSGASEQDAYRHTLTSFGIDESAHDLAAFQAINRALWAAVERQEMTPDQVRVLRFERLVQHLGLDAAPSEMADRYVAGLSAFGDLYPGAKSVLEALAMRATLALVTNGISEVQRARIDRLEIARYFDAVVVSGEVGVAKPSAAIFDLAFDLLGNPPKESALMVGDSLSSDMAGGKNYGIATCWYNPAGTATPSSDGVTHEIRSLSQLVAIIEP